jgi:TonB family protein
MEGREGRNFMAAAKKNGVTLRITGPDGSIQETVADSESIIVGSGAAAAVKLQDPRVSNLHLMLKVDPSGAVTAIDLGSESGTQVKGQRLLIPMALASGDVLTVGGSQLTVLFGEPAREPAPLVPAAVAAPALQEHAPLRAAPVPPPVVLGAAPANAARPAAHAAPVPVVNPPRPAHNAPVVGAPRTAPNVPVAKAPLATPRLNTPTGAPPNLRARPAAAPARTVQPPAMRRPARPPHLQDPLPPEAQPTATEKVLQVALFWGDQMMGVEHYRDGVTVKVGEGKVNDFHLFAPELGKSFPLAVSRGDKLELRVPAGTGVILTQHGNVRSKESLRAAGQLTVDGQQEVLTLGLHDRAEVAFGNVAFVVRHVRPSPLVIAKESRERDYTFFKITSVCLLGFGAFIAAMFLSPRSEQRSMDDELASQAAVAKFLVTKKPEPPKPQKLSGAEEGAKAEKEEGKFGKEEAKQAEAAPSKPGAPTVQKDKKEIDRKKVASAGLLGALKGKNGAVSDVFGPGGLGSGINNALGGVKGGAAMGDARGVGGLGSRGTGPGGGGNAIGLGGLGTQGTGRGTGGGGIDLGGRGKDITKIIPGKTTVVGGLDKDVIQKVIRRHQNEIKYCYESELNRKPDLAGKVAVAFTIDPTGSVSEASVTETTLGSSAAEQCMLSRIRRWKFPEPKGGGVVAVTYPWLFSPAGS